MRTNLESFPFEKRRVSRRKEGVRSIVQGPSTQPQAASLPTVPAFQTLHKQIGLPHFSANPVFRGTGLPDYSQQAALSAQAQGWRSLTVS